MFVNPQGLQLKIKKQPRVKEGKEARLARLQTVASEMLKGGIRPTHRNLGSLGFGTRVVSQWFREQKEKKREEEQKDVK